MAVVLKVFRGIFFETLQKTKPHKTKKNNKDKQINDKIPQTSGLGLRFILHVATVCNGSMLYFSLFGHFLKLLSQSSWGVALVASCKLEKKKKKNQQKFSRTLDFNSCWQFLRINLLNSDSCFLSLKQLIYHRWGLCFGYTHKKRIYSLLKQSIKYCQTLYIFHLWVATALTFAVAPIIGSEQLLTGFGKRFHSEKLCLM